jgi:RNA polymerase sigma-70 factor (ECF subfamily)
MKIFNPTSVNISERMNAKEASWLISECAAGNHAAIEMLVRQYEAGVFKLAYFILSDEADAHEITQETFVAALRSLKNYREKKTFKAWLYTIALNLSRSQLRKRKVSERLKMAVGGIFRVETQKQATPEDQVIETEKETAIWNELNKLDERHRIVVVLRQTLQNRLDIRPLPLKMDVIYSAVDHRRNISNFLAVRTALIGITLVVFAVITWQSMTVKDFSSKQMLPNTTGILVPTPSTHTATSTIQSDCKETKYIVQPGDTLDGIALTFSIARESILLANHLMDETLAPSRELILPICKSTPTGTTHPPSRLRRCSR